MTHPSLSPQPIDYWDKVIMAAYPATFFLAGFLVGLIVAWRA